MPDMFDGPAGIVFRIKQTTFERDMRDRAAIILTTNEDGSLTLHRWAADGVFPSHDYEDGRKAVARIMQLLNIGPVAPQTWPEQTFIGRVEQQADDT